MKMLVVGLLLMAGFAGTAQAERRCRRVCVQPSTQSCQSYSGNSGYASYTDYYGNPISAAEYDRQLAVYNAYYGIGTTPTYYTQNTSGTSYGTTNNYGTSYNTINNYGNSHLTVNNYGTGRTTVNDYGDSLTTYRYYAR